MKKNFYYILAVAIVFVGVASVGLAQTWTGPTQDPPAENTLPPINVSGTAQTKVGGIMALFLSASQKIELLSSGFLDLGFGLSSPVVLREPSAGKIRYNDTSNPKALDVFGGGTAVGSRNVRIFDNLIGGDPGSQICNSVGACSTFTDIVNNTSGGTLPPGTTGQTLRHDGLKWIANNLLFNNGTNIGIGTVSPAATAKLNIAGSGGEMIRLSRTDGVTQYFSISGPGGTGYPITFSINGGTQEVMRFPTQNSTYGAGNVILGGGGGNVGIGSFFTTSILPQSKLDVAGQVCGLNSSGVRVCLESSGGTGGGVSGTLNRVAKFTPNGTTVGDSQILDNGTNVGIGTFSGGFDNPFAKLHVKGSLLSGGNFIATSESWLFGNVSIGTSDKPQAKLHIGNPNDASPAVGPVGETGTIIPQMIVRNTISEAGSPYRQAIFAETNDDAWAIFGYNSNTTGNGLGIRGRGSNIGVWSDGPIRISGGSPGVDKILAATNASGDAVWKTLDELGGGGFWAPNGTNGINNTNSGNVGIGTATPDPGAKLTTTINSNNTNFNAGSPVAIFQNSNSTPGNFAGINFRDNNEDVAGVYGVLINHTNNTADLGFWTRNAGVGAEKMRILANGNVGIGQPNPTGKLEVKQPLNDSDPNSGLMVTNYNGSSRFRIFMNGSVPNIWAGATGNGPLVLNAGGGPVGINVSNPTSQLHVSGSVTLAGLGEGIDTVTFSRFLATDSGGNVRWRNVSSLGGLPTGTINQTLRHNGTNWIANTNIFNNGVNVGIGTASPSTFAKLHVKNTASNSTGIVAEGVNYGVFGFGDTGIQGVGTGPSSVGVYGLSEGATGGGVFGDGHTGVYGRSDSAGGSGIFATQANSGGYAISAVGNSRFLGSVIIGVDSISPVTQFNLDGTVLFAGLPVLAALPTDKFLASDARGNLKLSNISDISGGGLSGTVNKVAKFTSATAIGNSQITDNGTNVRIGGANLGYAKLEVDGGTGNGILASSNSTIVSGRVALTVQQNSTGYAIYSQGGTNYFGGSVGINAAASPLIKLQVGRDGATGGTDTVRFTNLPRGNVAVDTSVLVANSSGDIKWVPNSELGGGGGGDTVYNRLSTGAVTTSTGGPGEPTHNQYTRIASCDAGDTAIGAGVKANPVYGTSYAGNTYPVNNLSWGCHVDVAGSLNFANFMCTVVCLNTTP